MALWQDSGWDSIPCAILFFFKCFDDHFFSSVLRKQVLHFTLGVWMKPSNDESFWLDLRLKALFLLAGCGDRYFSTDSSPLLAGCQRAAAFISGECRRSCHSLLLPAVKVSRQIFVWEKSLLCLNWCQKVKQRNTAVMLKSLQTYWNGQIRSNFSDSSELLENSCVSKSVVTVWGLGIGFDNYPQFNHKS